MQAPLVDTRAATRDVHEQAHIPPTAATLGADASLPSADEWTLVNWAEVPVTDDKLCGALLAQTTARVDGPEPAGSPRSVAEDDALVAALGERAAGVVIFAKGWEPPSGDLADFVSELRDRIDAAQPVVVAPVGVESDSVRCRCRGRVHMVAHRT